MDINNILRILWKIRDKDEFYFKSYGKQLLTDSVEDSSTSASSSDSKCEIVLRGLQVKNLDKARKLAKALSVIEEECGIRNVKITIEDVFFCDWIDKNKLDNTEMEKLLRDLFIEVYGE